MKLNLLNEVQITQFVELVRKHPFEDNYAILSMMVEKGYITIEFANEVAETNSVSENALMDATIKIAQITADLKSMWNTDIDEVDRILDKYGSMILLFKEGSAPSAPPLSAPQQTLIG